MILLNYTRRKIYDSFLRGDNSLALFVCLIFFLGPHLLESIDLLGKRERKEMGCKSFFVQILFHTVMFVLYLMLRLDSSFITG